MPRTLTTTWDEEEAAEALTALRHTYRNVIDPDQDEPLRPEDQRLLNAIRKLQQSFKRTGLPVPGGTL